MSTTIFMYLPAYYLPFYYYYEIIDTANKFKYDSPFIYYRETV